MENMLNYNDELNSIMRTIENKFTNDIRNILSGASTLDEYNTRNSEIFNSINLNTEKQYQAKFKELLNAEYNKGLIGEKKELFEDEIIITNIEITDKLISRYISEGRIQELLNFVAEDKHKFTVEQAQAIYDEVRSMKGDFLLSIETLQPYGEERVSHTTFGESIKERFVKMVSGGGMWFKPRGNKVSDDFGEYDINDIKNITFKPINRPSRIIANKNGRFFARLNATSIDLSEYQIYTEEQTHDKELMEGRKHCLIGALYNSGVANENLFELREAYNPRSSIPKNKMKIIAETIHHNIILYQIDKSSKNKRTRIRKTLYDCKKKGENSIPNKGDVHIALYNKHYFKYEETGYSRFFINNYERLKDVKDPYKITKIQTHKNKKINNSEPIGDLIDKILKENKNICYYDAMDRINNTVTYFRKGDRKTSIHSLQLIEKLDKKGYFVKGDMKVFVEASINDELKDHVYLNNIEEEQREMKDVKVIIKSDEEWQEKIESLNIFYSDCESVVNKKLVKHNLLMLGTASNSDINNLTKDNVSIFHVCDPKFNGEEQSSEQLVVNAWLNRMTDNGRKDALCYFHNLKYDYHLIEKYLNISKKCEKSNQFYMVTIRHKVGFKKSVKVVLVDSYKLLSMALCKFHDSFNLPEEICKKEAIWYQYYTKENHNIKCGTNKYRKHLPRNQQLIFDNFLDQCSEDKTMALKYGYIIENGIKKFNPTEYYKEYLRLDCLVLKYGLKAFNKMIMEITKNKMIIYESLTISSLTDMFMKIEGAYKGIYEVQGNLRAYIAKAVRGGRVCVNEKFQKKILEGKFTCLDGVSLYPSAIKRLCIELGLPTGPARRLIDKSKWNEYIYSIVTVKITKVKIHQQLPMISYKEDGKIIYSNIPPKESIVVDSITLQDYIKFHAIEYEIEDGVYWNDGVNKKMGEIIQNLFNKRLECKESKPPRQSLGDVLKLMLNSAYGKTITNKIYSKKNIIKISGYQKNKTTKKWEEITKDKWDNYLYNNFNTIKSFRYINEQQIEVKEIQIDDSYNRGHVGCAILSMSKRIMNEIFDICNSNDIILYYTDTDSMHLNFDEVNKLAEKYEEVYGRKLIGKDLGNFHNDFEIKGVNHTIYSVLLIPIARKTYHDTLEYVNDNGEKIQHPHNKLKGITKAGLEDAAKNIKFSHDGKTPNYANLYKFLAQDGAYNMILNPINKEENIENVTFKYDQEGVFTTNQFTRMTCFIDDNKKRPSENDLDWILQL